MTEQMRQANTPNSAATGEQTDTEGHMIAEYEDAYGWKGKIGTGGESLVQPTGRDPADVGAQMVSNLKYILGEFGKVLLPGSPF